MTTMMTALTKQEKRKRQEKQSKRREDVQGLFPQSFHEGSEGVGFEF
jgi:hypothetical protein